jgi:hypothetical protein
LDIVEISRYVWYALIGGLVVSILVTTAKAFGVFEARGGTAGNVVTVAVECASCGWTGEVPRLRRRCPMCGDTNFTT